MLWPDKNIFSRLWLDVVSTVWPDQNFILLWTLCVCPIWADFSHTRIIPIHFYSPKVQSTQYNGHSYKVYHKNLSCKTYCTANINKKSQNVLHVTSSLISWTFLLFFCRKSHKTFTIKLWFLGNCLNRLVASNCCKYSYLKFFTTYRAHFFTVALHIFRELQKYPTWQYILFDKGLIIAHNDVWTIFTAQIYC